GRATCVKKILEHMGGEVSVEYLSARVATDVTSIDDLVRSRTRGRFIIDDFHRLSESLQAQLADLAKISAEQGREDGNYPKLVLIGINQIGSDLIQLVPDIAKRTGIHRVQPGTQADIQRL